MELLVPKIDKPLYTLIIRTYVIAIYTNICNSYYIFVYVYIISLDMI